MELQAFGLINWSILGIYLVGNIVLGAVLSKKVTSADDFFVGQRYNLGVQAFAFMWDVVRNRRY